MARKKASKKLPKTIHARWEYPTNSNEEPWLTASPTMAGVMDDDGPETIGVYKLAKTVRVEKVLKTR